MGARATTFGICYDDVMKALELMVKEDKGRLAVTEKDRIIGLITRHGIAQYLQIKGK